MTTPDYQHLYDNMKVRPLFTNAINLAAQHIAQFKVRYTLKTKSNIPWYGVGLIHYMEASQNFNKHLHNGDSLSQRTTHVPAGRPLKGTPPFTWETSAIDA